jgi:glycosyltransferase involved in cell wall biosynthesis
MNRCRLDVSLTILSPITLHMGQEHFTVLTSTRCFTGTQSIRDDLRESMPHGKTISVALCTYNGEKFLREQLESIADQTRRPTELVVCDDRSTDSTADIIQSFAGSAPFPVKFHINAVNVGGSAKGITRNFAATVMRCTGNLIVPCDQDDVWLPRKLADMAQAMEENPQLGGIFSDAQLINDLGMPKGILLSETAGLTVSEQERLACGDALPILLSMTKVYGCTLMFDARLLEKILPIPPHWWFDAWVACMVAVHSKLGFTPEPLFLYRIHATQSVSASLPTVSERVKRWRRSAKDYWKESEPQLTDLYSRLAAEDSPSMKPHLEYISGRMDLLRFRAALPSNPLFRMMKVIPETRNYHRYFNGWKSVIKDLTA